MTTTLLLIRHGQTPWNLQEINLMQGISDGEENQLNDAGLEQAQKLAETMWKKHPDVCPIFYSADLKRVLKTAEKTAEKFRSEKGNFEKIVERKDLQEANFGVFEGRPYPEFKAAEDLLKSKYSDWKKERSNPKAETMEEVILRGKRAMADIAAKHPGQTVAVFTSGRFIRMLIVDCTGDENAEGVSNCAITQFESIPTGIERQLKFIKIEKPDALETEKK